MNSRGLISALDRKLLRELVQLRGQIATIALVLASGITSFIALRGTYLSLEEARAAYYDRTRFRARFCESGAGARLGRSQARVVARRELLETRVSKEVTIPIEGLARPAYGRLLSLPTPREPLTNTLTLVSGRTPERGHDDRRSWCSRPSRKRHGLHRATTCRWSSTGSSAPASGRPRPVPGVRLRPAARSDRRGPQPLRGALDGGAHALDSLPDAGLVQRRQPAPATRRLREPAVLAAIDRVLSGYGSNGAFGRNRQVSNRILDSELGQLANLSGMVPLVFLGVALFPAELVLGRLIRLPAP